ncbi:hypothetical protein Gotur_034027 [Gossypium turneri]
MTAIGGNFADSKRSASSKEQ